MSYSKQIFHSGKPFHFQITKGPIGAPTVVDLSTTAGDTPIAKVEVVLTVPTGGIGAVAPVLKGCVHPCRYHPEWVSNMIFELLEF